jgi:hypothetical protein
MKRCVVHRRRRTGFFGGHSGIWALMAARPPRRARAGFVPVIFRAVAVPRLEAIVRALNWVAVDIELDAEATAEAACFSRSYRTLQFRFHDSSHLTCAAQCCVQLVHSEGETSQM